MVKKSVSKKSGKPANGCQRQTTKRYTERNSPPFPGTACCGQTKLGNDGQPYVSKQAADGSCRWHPMTTRSKAPSSEKGCG